MLDILGAHAIGNKTHFGVEQGFGHHHHHLCLRPTAHRLDKVGEPSNRKLGMSARSSLLCACSRLASDPETTVKRRR